MKSHEDRSRCVWIYMTLLFGFLTNCVVIEKNTAVRPVMKEPASAEKHTISESIHGKWQVYDGHWTGWADSESDIWFKFIGELEIRDTNYVFLPDSNVCISPQMRDRFAFIDWPQGRFMVQYYKGIIPGNLPEDQGIDDILATCNFNGGESFYIRVAREEEEFYFHSQKSEIQLYRIVKLYKKE